MKNLILMLMLMLPTTIQATSVRILFTGTVPVKSCSYEKHQSLEERTDFIAKNCVFLINKAIKEVTAPPSSNNKTALLIEYL